MEHIKFLYIFISPQRTGGMYDVIELWPDEHAKTDEFRRLKK